MGVGQQLLDACLENANMHSLDTYLDSTPVGRPLYEANGFSYIKENTSAPINNNTNSDGWEANGRQGWALYFLAYVPPDSSPLDGWLKYSWGPPMW